MAQKIWLKISYSKIFTQKFLLKILTQIFLLKNFCSKILTQILTQNFWLKNFWLKNNDNIFTCVSILKIGILGQQLRSLEGAGFSQAHVLHFRIVIAIMTPLTRKRRTNSRCFSETLRGSEPQIMNCALYWATNWYQPPVFRKRFWRTVNIFLPKLLYGKSPHTALKGNTDVTLLLHRTVFFTHINLNTTLQVVVVKCHLHRRYSICSLYLSPRAKSHKEDNYYRYHFSTLMIFPYLGRL